MVEEKHDMYELLAIWNCPDKVKFNGELNFLKEMVNIQILIDV